MYYVLVHIKTLKGMVEIGKYFLGKEPSFAIHTFAQLQGKKDKEEVPCIRLDLVHEPLNTLPVCLKSIGCNLGEYTHNCAFLTRVIFRQFIFEEFEE